LVLCAHIFCCLPEGFIAFDIFIVFKFLLILSVFS
jgi:hypothetical protein